MVPYQKSRFLITFSNSIRSDLTHSASFFWCFLLLFWPSICFKEAFLIVTYAYFGRICSRLCSLKCANYSYFCFARSISARFLLVVCAPDTPFSALCTALVSVVFTAFTTSRFMCWVFRCHCACLYEAYIYIVFCLYDIMILQHHILCRFLEVGPCPPAQTVVVVP